MRSTRRLAIAALSMSIVVACGSDPIASAGDPLQGLKPVSVADTTTPPPGPAAPGYFHGSVIGYSTGADSVNVPLGNVRVTAHARVNGVAAAAEAAEAYSDGNGLWELPVLPAGEYAVIYQPGPTSSYNGGYTIATTQATSAFWTVMLAKK